MDQEAPALWDRVDLGHLAVLRELAQRGSVTAVAAAELLVPGLLDGLVAVPGIVLETFDEDVSQDDFAALTDDYDIVVAHRSDDVVAPARPRFVVRPLMREPLDVALPLDHPLAGR